MSEIKIVPFSIYRPNSQSTGAALQIHPANDKTCLFMECTNAQVKGEKKFDWTNKIIVKLEPVDCGKIMLVLTGKSSKVELYHSTPKYNTSISIVAQDKVPKVFYLNIFRKTQDADGKVSQNKVSVAFGEDDAAILSALINFMFPYMYSWC